MYKRSLFAGLLAIPALLLTSTAQATPVTGQANIVGNVTVTADSILFNPTFGVPNGSSNTGDFAGLTGGTIQSLTNGPATGVVNVQNFITFSQGVAAPINFDLNYIAPGVGTQAGCGSSSLGSACTPSGSPFTLFQLSSNTVIAALQLNGISYTGTSATGSTPTTSIFSTQTALNGTLPEVIAQLGGGSGITGITYSASFVASSPVAPSVPEPASMFLMGAGLLGAGLVARRKARV